MSKILTTLNFTVLNSSNPVRSNFYRNNIKGQKPWSSGLNFRLSILSSLSTELGQMHIGNG